jgi:hypothetical protein
MAVRVAAGRTGGHQEQDSWPSGWPQVGQTSHKEQASWPSGWPQVGQAAIRMAHVVERWPSTGWPQVGQVAIKVAAGRREMAILGERWPSGRPQVGEIFVRVAPGRRDFRQGGPR